MRFASFRKSAVSESRPVDSLVAEAERLAAQGVKELDLIAQDLTAYGRERRDGTTLLTLLRALSRVDGIAWIRLLYCYPNYLDDALLRYLAEEEKICSYLDMPLQHISDRMLRAMRREKSGDGIRRLLERIRTHIPGSRITNVIYRWVSRGTRRRLPAASGFYHRGANRPRRGLSLFTRRRDCRRDVSTKSQKR